MRLTNKDYKDRVGEAFDDLVFLANINPNDVCKFPVKNLREQELKLGQLEDIEEELGIDLITLFKALTNDYVYIYHNKKITKCEQAPCLLCFDGDYCLEYHFGNDIEQVNLKDYGETWALTKRELL